MANSERLLEKLNEPLTSTYGNKSWNKPIKNPYMNGIVYGLAAALLIYLGAGLYDKIVGCIRNRDEKEMLYKIQTTQDKELKVDKPARSIEYIVNKD